MDILKELTLRGGVFVVIHQPVGYFQIVRSAVAARCGWIPHLSGQPIGMFGVSETNVQSGADFRIDVRCMWNGQSGRDF